jgi:hypothetical protein
MRRRRLVLVALLAFTFGCRTCGTETGETTYDTFDGKVRLELVRSTDMGDYGWRSNFRIVVHAAPQFAIPVPCSKVKFAEAPDGKLFAFHCSARADGLGASDAWIGKWHLVRLLGNGAFVVGADPPMTKKLPWGQTPDFAAVQPLNRAADEIFASWKVDPNVKQNLVALSSALAAESSDAEAAAFLERHASEQVPRAETDPWPIAFAALAAAGHPLAPGCCLLPRLRSSPEAHGACSPRHRSLAAPGSAPLPGFGGKSGEGGRGRHTRRATATRRSRLLPPRGRFSLAARLRVASLARSGPWRAMLCGGEMPFVPGCQADRGRPRSWRAPLPGR